jgi:hypothetical protein
MNWKKGREEADTASFEAASRSAFLDEPKNNREKPQHDCRCFIRDSNHAPTEYKSEPLGLERLWSVVTLQKHKMLGDFRRAI